MAKLSWERWHRSNGFKNHTASNGFGGVSFSDIFLDAMRMMFIDEKGSAGLLYDGSVFPASLAAVALNGRLYGFKTNDQSRMLQQGDFRYADSDFLGPLVPGGRLLFEGPDEDQLGSDSYARAPIGKGVIKVNFYKIIDDAAKGQGNFAEAAVPQNANGAKQLSAFTAAVVLHEIMHNHGFEHPEDVNYVIGSDYASSLPHVAYWSALEAAKAKIGPNFLPNTAAKSIAKPLRISVASGTPESGFGVWQPVGGATARAVNGVAFDGRLYLYGRGLDDRRIYQNSAGPNQSFAGWSEVQGGGITNDPVSAAALGDRLYLVGRGTDGGAYINSAKAKQPFGAWETMLPTKTYLPLAATAVGEYLYVVGVGSDRQVYVTWAKQGQPFGKWDTLYAFKTDKAPAIALFKGQIHIFAVADDGRIHVTFGYPGVSWSKWTELPGGGRTNVGVSAVPFNNRLYVAGKGIDDKGVYITSASETPNFNGWKNIPGRQTFDTPAIVPFQNMLHVFAVSP